MTRQRPTKWPLAVLATTLLGCGGGSGAKPPAKLSHCQTITVAAFHEEVPELGNPFMTNQRLALIQDGSVPCVDVETAAPGTCPFVAGNWLEDDRGRRFAQVGQAVSKDASPVGDHVIAARVQDDDTVPCVGATGFDTMGWVSPGTELVEACVLEEILAPSNNGYEWIANRYVWAPLVNFTTIPVCSSNDPSRNPPYDMPTLVSEDRAAGVFCYAGTGAALNDLNGRERDGRGEYLSGSLYCHSIRSGGLEVPGAKRPATRSLPAPGAVNPKTPILWRPVNPMIAIANGYEGRGAMSEPITPYFTKLPESLTVVEGQPARFTADAMGTKPLTYSWQRDGRGQAGTATLVLPAVALSDDGATFRVQVANYWGTAISQTVTLTVTKKGDAPAPAGAVTLSLLPVVGLRAQAEITSMRGIDEDVGGTFTFITGSRLKRLSADLGTITPVAGRAASGAADGVGEAASFAGPTGLTHDADGIIYVADTDNHTIRRVTPDGAVTTLAGLAGTAGSTDGTGASARFSRPNAIAIGPDGDLYVCDLDSHRIRRVTRAGVVTTYAGSAAGLADGGPLSARFNSPGGIAVAANGDVLVADTSNNRVRRITRMGNGAGFVETLAGNDVGGAASPDGVGTAAFISNPRAIVLRGNTLTVWDAAGLLRQIDLTTKTVSTLTGSRALGTGFADGTAMTARLRDLGAGVTGVAGGGFLLVDDQALRHVSASGAVKTIALARATGAAPEGVGTLAQVPFGLDLKAVAVDPAGNVVVADGTNRMVRRISPAGVVTLVAGLPGTIGRGVEGLGSEAQFGDIGEAIASDAAGRIYVGDGYRIRRIGPDGATAHVAGGVADFGAADGDALTARFNRVFGLAVSPAGQVFVGDGNNAVRRVDTVGNVTTYAGTLGQAGIVDGPAATARFNQPGQVALGPDGALYVVERLAGRLRRVAPGGASVSTVVDVGLTGSVASDAAGALYFGTSAGLETLPPGGGAPVVLLRRGEPRTLGAVAPRLPSVDSLAVLGPKQLVVVSKGELYTVTLP